MDENKACTNEKNKLYLNHLELSFVTQLHQSKRLSNVKNDLEKIKVLRNGCCKASLRAKLVCNFKRVGKNCHPPYRRKVSLYDERVGDLNLVTQERDDIKKQYDEWRKRRLDEFMAGFNTISLKLKEMYQV
ncbi:hypothetical protein CASFOL_001394 [Castilleja foliolosa]|uniref:Uncharacterized protein n=1 Tax=Castilleja foliolosa TaxID=1961234 RepID=A0ABD3EKB9_9LAMI